MNRRQIPASLDAHSFGKAVVRAGMVTLGAHVLSQLLRFCGNLILTRLLVPEAFGVMLVANAVWFGLILVTDFGFRQVVIRSPRAADHRFLDTVWTLQLGQGVFIASLLLAAAGLVRAGASMGVVPVGSTFSNPDVPWVIGWLSLAALLASGESTKLYVANRELQVARIASIELGAQVIALAVTLSWARSAGGVAALVAGACVGAACRTLATHLVLQGRRNRICYDAEAGREVLAFGAPIVLTSCIGFVISNGDKLMMGWLLPATAMGAYAIAVLLIAAFHEAAGKLMAQVAFPAISNALSHDPASLRANYLRVRTKVDAACLVPAGLLASCGDRLVTLLYDARYAQAGAYLSILAVSLLGVRYRLLSQVFLVIGRPRLMLYEQLSHLLALAVGIPLGFRLSGATGVVWAVALSYVSAQGWTVLYLQRRLGLFSMQVELQGLAMFAASAALGTVLRVLT